MHTAKEKAEWTVPERFELAAELHHRAISRHWYASCRMLKVCLQADHDKPKCHRLPNNRQQLNALLNQ